MSPYPPLTHHPPRTKTRPFPRPRKAHAFVSHSLYLLRTPTAIRTATHIDLIRGATQITPLTPTTLQITTPPTKPHTLHLHNEQDLLPLLTKLQTAVTSFSALHNAILTYRQSPDPHLKPFLHALRNVTPSPNRQSLSASLQSLVGVKGGVAIPNSAQWAQALAQAVSGTGAAVQALERVLGAVPLAAPVIGMMGLVSDLLELAAERGETEAEMRGMAMRCGAVVEDIVQGLFFCLDYDVEESAIGKLVAALGGVMEMAKVAEGFVMGGVLRQMGGVEEVKGLGGRLAEVEGRVVGLRVLLYVRENHLRGVKAGEKEVFRRAFVSGQVPVGVYVRRQGGVEGGLRDKLFEVECRSGVVAAVGMVGSGKSVLLKCVANDAGVRRYFDGGVYELDMTKGVAVALAETVRQSSGASLARRIASSEVDDAVRQTREWFVGHRCLFIYDDATNVEAVRTVVDLSVGARLLVATENRAVVDGVVNRRDVVHVALRSDEDARAMFEHCAELDGVRDGKREKAVREIVAACEGLPMALAVAGRRAGREGVEGVAGVAGGMEKVWEEVLGGVGEGVEGGLREVCVDGVGSEAVRGIYGGLCVLGGGVWTDVEVLRRVWGVEEGFVGRIVEALKNVHLVEGRDSEGGAQVRLHGGLHKYCARIAKEEGKFASWHGKLLASYGNWREKAGTDSFLRQNIARLLVYAGEWEQLEQLLLDFSWLESRLHDTTNTQHQLQKLLNDYSTLDNLQNLNEPQRTLQKALSHIADALRLSTQALTTHPPHLAFQLQGRLAHIANPYIVRLLATIQSVPRVTSVIPSLAPAASSLIRQIDVGFPLLSIAQIPHGKRVVVAGKGGVAVVHVERGVERVLGEKTRWSGDAESVAATEEYVVCGWESGRVDVWTVEGEEVVQIETCGRYVKQRVCVDVTLDGRHVVSGGADGIVRLWEIGSGKEVDKGVRHERKVEAVAVSPDGLLVASVDERTVRVSELESGREVRVVDVEGFFGMKFVAWTGEAGVLVGSEDRQVIEISVRDGLQRRFGRHEGYIMAADVGTDGRVVTGGFDGGLRVWEREGGLVDGVMWGHTECVYDVKYDEGEGCVLSGCYDGVLRMWRRPWGRGGWHDGEVRCLVASAGNDVVASGSSDKSVVLWDMKDGRKILGPLRGDKRSVRSVAFSRDGGKLAIGYQTGKVWIVDAKDGSVIHSGLKCHSRGVLGLDFSPDGRWLATGGEDKFASVWDVGSGENVFAKIGPHKNWVSCVAFSSDGKLLATGSFDDFVRFWDASTAQPIGEPIKAFGKPRRVCFEQQDSRIRVELGFLYKPLAFWVDTGEKIVDEKEMPVADTTRLGVVVEMNRRDVRGVKGEVWGRFDCDVSTAPVVDFERGRIWVGLKDGMVTCLELKR